MPVYPGCVDDVSSESDVDSLVVIVVVNEVVVAVVVVSGSCRPTNDHTNKDGCSTAQIKPYSTVIEGSKFRKSCTIVNFDLI